MYIEEVTLIRQIYPNDKSSIFKPIRINSTTRIAELITPYQKRILQHKNKCIENRIYLPKTNGRYSKNQNRLRPMHYTKVLCHACYKEIELHNLYLSKNGEHGRSKFYHITCANMKNIL